MPASQATNETRLPRAVLRRSAAIQARIDARSEPGADPADPNAPPAEPSAASATPAEATPPASPVPPTPPVDPRESDPAYWKQRFNVTAGVLRRERDERSEESQRLSQQLTDLQSQVRTLQATAVPTVEPELGQFLSPEQIETLGEDEAKAVVKAAMAAAQATVRDAIEVEIKPLREQRAAEATKVVKDRKQKFVDELTEFVPDYDEVDRTPEWIAWLKQDDEVTGVERQMLLDNLVGKLDAAKTAAMFTKFKALHKLPSPPIAPNGSGATPPGEVIPVDPSGLRAPTDAEVKDYFKRAAIGRVKDPERVQFEARLKLRRR